MGGQIEPHPQKKTTLKKPSLIRVKNSELLNIGNTIVA